MSPSFFELCGQGSNDISELRIAGYVLIFHGINLVIEKLLPLHLRDRGIEDPDRVCRLLVDSISNEPSVDAADSPEAIFARLGSR